MSRKTLSPCPRACCSVPPSQRPLPHWRNSALLRVLRLCLLVLLQASVPVVLLPVWAPAVLPSVVLRPDLSLAFRPVAARAHLRGVRRRSATVADCMASSVAARPIFAASRVAPRPTALTATVEIVTPSMAMAVATGTPMRRRRRRLTPMAEPMPLPTMAATTSPHTGDTAPGVFWSVMKTD